MLDHATLVMSTYKLIIKYSAQAYLDARGITAKALQLYSDEQIISIIENDSSGIAILLDNPSVAVQLATFRKSTMIAKCFKSPCEELQLLFLFN